VTLDVVARRLDVQIGEADMAAAAARTARPRRARRPEFSRSTLASSRRPPTRRDRTFAGVEALAEPAIAPATAVSAGRTA